MNPPPLPEISPAEQMRASVQRCEQEPAYQSIKKHWDDFSKKYGDLVQENNEIYTELRLYRSHHLLNNVLQLWIALGVSGLIGLLMAFGGFGR